MKKIVCLLGTILVTITMATNANAHSIQKEELIFKTVENEFKRVTSSELTPAVVEQILKEYPTSKLAAVYKNEKGQFKLIMVLQSGTRRTVYIDQYGRWFKPKRK